MTDFASIVKEHGNYKATVLADSIANNVRLTTVMVTFPRPYLAEFNTHRVFSRNSASSRAIPTERLIERVNADPYVPETFNARVKGMGVGAALINEDQDAARQEWLDAAEFAAARAQSVADIGIDKSRANRLLEPFMWHTAIITSTEWANFYGLRCPEGDKPDIEFPAQLEFQQTAILMRDAMRESKPVKLGNGEWHTPLVDWEETWEACAHQFKLRDDLEISDQVLKVCARRLARVSFDKHMDTEPVVVSVEKADQLAESGHFSPTEHIATPLTHDYIAARPSKIHVPVSEVIRAMRSGDAGYDSIRELRLSECWSGNLRGFWQYRKGFRDEEAVASTGEWPS